MKTQEQMHVENEHRLTRLEILVVGLYVVLIGMRAEPAIVGYASAHFP